MIDGDIAFCRDMIWTDDVQGARLVGESSDIFNVFGSMQLGSSMSFGFLGDVRFQGTNQNNIIDMQGQGFAKMVSFNGVGASWELASGMSVDSLLVFEEGDLNTASFPVVCERLRVRSFPLCPISVF